MPEPGSPEYMWQQRFSAVDAEISKMAALCGIDLRERTQLLRVLDGDAGVCSRDNALAFEKLHTLLKAHYLLRDRAAESIGQAAVQRAIDEVVSELIEKFSAVPGGSAGG
ncbi:MAG: hypothetical protein MUD07_05320 [Burkholderiaceae bacterium]|nr:hypothetical protein [Burkholderiaceae bacterium]